jgi:hypothetical protein
MEVIITHIAATGSFINVSSGLAVPFPQLAVLRLYQRNFDVEKNPGAASLAEHCIHAPCGIGDYH